MSLKYENQPAVIKIPFISDERNFLYFCMGDFA